MCFAPDQVQFHVAVGAHEALIDCDASTTNVAQASGCRNSASNQHAAIARTAAGEARRIATGAVAVVTQRGVLPLKLPLGRHVRRLVPLLRAKPCEHEKVAVCQVERKAKSTEPCAGAVNRAQRLAANASECLMIDRGHPPYVCKLEPRETRDQTRCRKAARILAARNLGDTRQLLHRQRRLKSC